MRFLIDNQLPLQLAKHLRGRGHDCLHVLELGLDEATDAELWACAAREQRVLVSNDEDFVFLANRPDDTGRLVWIRLGNCRNTALIAAIDRIHDVLIQSLDTGQKLIEIR